MSNLFHTMQLHLLLPQPPSCVNHLLDTENQPQCEKEVYFNQNKFHIPQNLYFIVTFASWKMLTGNLKWTILLEYETGKVTRCSLASFSMQTSLALLIFFQYCNMQSSHALTKWKSSEQLLKDSSQPQNILHFNSVTPLIATCRTRNLNATQFSSFNGRIAMNLFNCS